MADPTITLKTKRITELFSFDPLIGDELIPMYQAGVTKKLTTIGIGDYMKTYDFSTWVYSNSAIQKSTSDWVTNNKDNIINQIGWVSTNSVREKAATDLVNLSAANWKAAYDFSQNIISGNNSQLTLGSDSIGTSNIINGSVTPNKLSTGAPTWDANSVSIPASSLKINQKDAETFVYLNNNGYGKNSNLIHTGSGKFNIKSESYLGDIVIQTVGNADISLKTGSTERINIDGETGNTVFYNDITAPKGTFTTVSVTNIDISNIAQANFKISNSGTLQFLNSNNQNRFYIGSPSSDKFNIYNNVTNSTSIFIDNTNKVGIGNNNPSYPLDVTGTTRAYGLVCTNTTGTSPIDAKIQLIKSDASANKKTWEIVNDNNAALLIRTINDAATQSNNGIAIYRTSTADHGIDRITLGTSGGSVMTVFDGGAIGVGYNTKNVLPTESGGSFLFNVNGSAYIDNTVRLGANAEIFMKNGNSIRWTDPTTATTYYDCLTFSSSKTFNIKSNGIYFKTLADSALGNFDTSGNFTSTGDIAAFSDEKLKKNVKTIENALEKVNSLRGVEYERIDINQKGMGFIAQELEKILPCVVNQQGDYKTVSYGNITGILVEAIKELSKEIEYLKSKLT